MAIFTEFEIEFFGPRMMGRSALIYFALELTQAQCTVSGAVLSYRLELRLSELSPRLYIDLNTSPHKSFEPPANLASGCVRATSTNSVPGMFVQEGGMRTK